MAKDSDRQPVAGDTPATPPTNPTPPASPPAAALAKPETAPANAVAAPSADGKAEYTVTERAGPRVAGHRALKGAHLRLTAEEARSELLTGAIVRKGEKLHEQLRASAKPRDPITKLRPGETPAEDAEKAA